MGNGQQMVVLITLSIFIVLFFVQLGGCIFLAVTCTEVFYSDKRYVGKESMHVGLS